MGFLKKLRLTMRKEPLINGADECIKMAQKIIADQKDMSERLDRVAATLNGEGEWFLTFARREGGERNE